MADDFEGVPDALGRCVAGEHRSLLLVRGVKRCRRRGGDENDGSQAVRPPAGQYLDDLSAHGMSNEDKVLQLQRLDYTFDVVGEEAVIIGIVVRLAPAAQVHGDAAEAFGERRYDLRPGAPRAAPVMEKYQSRAAVALFFCIDF
jgi:hypothetical protein